MTYHPVLATTVTSSVDDQTPITQTFTRLLGGSTVVDPNTGQVLYQAGKTPPGGPTTFTLSYTVNDEWAAQRLIGLGTDGIITDRIDLFSPA